VELLELEREMGVITTCRLDEGTVFGPVPPSMTLADPIVLIGHRTGDTLLDIHTVKVSQITRIIIIIIIKGIYIAQVRKGHKCE